MELPPLPSGPTPERAPDVESRAQSDVSKGDDDGWEAIYDDKASKWKFYNRITKQTTYNNPRVKQKQNQDSDPVAEKLRKDPEFHKMSTFEKYKRYKELSEELRQDHEGTQKNNDQEIKGPGENKQDSEFVVSEYIDKDDDPSRLLNRESKGKSYKQQRAAQKITKRDIKRFQKKRQERKKKRFEEWYNGGESTRQEPV